ncbi:MAG: inositol monophosphatase [Proteobacteria bacterium]|nr:inositol monophosphatase [Pseudomonadota bacterium]MBU1741285.1 inositol monophosphatase [Pseudomonadota bacterium]
MHHFLQEAMTAARTAAEIILDHYHRHATGQIDKKGAADFVTQADRAAEEAIMDHLGRKFPDHRFLAEESARDRTGGRRWIIDPLDGTTNFIHGYPMFAVSIALENDGQLLLGVVYDPLRDEMFAAQSGRGAWLNDQPIQVSAVSDPLTALVATGFPFRNRDKIDLYLAGFKRVFLRVGGLRRAGSAALDLVHVACGRLDGFFELGLAPWDVAAGTLIIGEAGGKITDVGGDPDKVYSGNVVGGNPIIHEVLLEALQPAWPSDKLPTGTL